jgi:hypothetical protein
MYFVAVLLFSIPLALIFVGWRRVLRASHESSQSNWRTKCRTGSLVVASFAVPTGLAFILAWLHSGGNPHGMGTPPGVWQIFVRVFWGTLVVSVILATLGKGEGRFPVLGAAVAAILADYAVIMLDMD